jgi:hypothetical protein
MRLINTFSVREGDRVAPSEGQRHDASLSATAVAGVGVDIMEGIWELTREAPLAVV